MKSTSVSVAGDREFVNQLKTLAASKGISLAKLTREALDAVYGEELKALTVFFAAPSVAQKPQKMHKSNTKTVNGT